MSRSTIQPQMLQQLITGRLPNFDCGVIHPDATCNQKAYTQILLAVKSVKNMYLVVHLVPFLLFKLKRTRKNPKTQLLKLTKNYLKSLLFAGAFLGLVRRVVCLLWKLDSLIRVEYINWLSAVIAGTAVIFEEPGRRAQIALFTMARTQETIYLLMKRRRWVKPLANGESLLLASALTIISYFYFDCPSAIKPTYLKMLDYLFQSI